MATSLSNIFSFILPSNPPLKAPPPPPPSHLSLSSNIVPNPQKPRNALISKVAQESHNSSSSHLSTELASVICPSLVYANTLFFKSAYNVQVIVDENEPEERLLNRFRREVMKAGVIQECKRRRFYENKQDEKKRKTREAAKRNRRRRTGGRFSFQNRQEPSANKKKEVEEEDNWELPEGDIPY
ncbi:30S ribosomal protein S21, chloroplastic isoform X1 [Pistacia vera]|uniref:30S ribosomal protein S21, chloroplastic isoform X1 n=1 Tax=Pistacia vera TaxID=55513 RepID=UPI001262DF73|nr:30S ribosomal protein S21, chloroplastic isoform X1 [Pistacia vera]